MIQSEGSGWRLERDKSRLKFSVLIGGDNWAVELSEKEWNSLKPVVLRLLEQYESCRSTLMPEEVILRSLSVLLKNISKKEYPPRGKKLIHLIIDIKKNQYIKATLGGTIIEKIRNSVTVLKEKTKKH